MPNPMPADFGLGDNRCQPHKNGRDDRGFALLNNDPWFLGNAAAIAQQPDYKLRFQDVTKRGLFQNDMAVLGVNGSSNATTYDQEEEAPTREQLLAYFGIKQCKEKSCKEELEEIGLDSIRIAYADPATEPAVIAATATAVKTSGTATVTAASQREPEDTNRGLSRSLVTASLPKMTPSQHAQGVGFHKRPRRN